MILSVILPGYNEREALAAALERYREGLARCGIEDYEILVVDDGSIDGMGELADRLAAGQNRLRVLHQPNAGQVAAIRNGFAHARGRFLTHNGMDLPFDPADTRTAIEPLEAGADLVVVERQTRQSYGLVRKVVSWGNLLLVRLLLGSGFRDHNFVQFYRREVIEAIAIQTRGVSTVTAEWILRARRMGFHVVVVRAAYHARRTGRSTITLRKVVRAVGETFALWRAMRRCRTADRQMARERAAAERGAEQKGA